VGNREVHGRDAGDVVAVQEERHQLPHLSTWAVESPLRILHRSPLSVEKR
jgi:hypothetical protein